MKLQHWMKQETSGLAFTTLELVDAEQQAGHDVCVCEPNGNVLYGSPFTQPDVDLIHSQFPPQRYHNGIPRFMYMHGEPISSVGNGVSMRAIVDLAPVCDAFICMREEEVDYWSPIKRTYRVPKGIDLDTFRPLRATEAGKKLSGAPAVLYIEHWRGQRNPLPLVIAMLKVWKEYPEARLHLWNCTDKRMYETFHSLIKHAKLETYVRSLQGPVVPADVNQLINRADIVVSCLYPFYARSIEALGAGKGFLCPGYTDQRYPWHCTLDPADMARAIIDLWENGCGKFDFRGFAEQHHDVRETVRQSIAIYERYLGEPNERPERTRRQGTDSSHADNGGEPAPAGTPEDRPAGNADRSAGGADHETQGPAARQPDRNGHAEEILAAGDAFDSRLASATKVDLIQRQTDHACIEIGNLQYRLSKLEGAR